MKFNKYFKDNKIENDALVEDEYLDKGLVIVGKVDMLVDDIKETIGESEKINCVEVPFSGHGFLDDMDKELSNDVFTIVNKFI